MKLAVIGKDVTNSLSPRMHGFIAGRTGNCVQYDKISLPEHCFHDEVGRLFEAYDGFNVTIPYKVEIIPHLKELLGDAAVFGAVNTVRCFDATGHNTDGAGFALMLRNSGIDVRGKRVLLLGAGGAGRSVAKKLSDEGAVTLIYDKNRERAATVAREFQGVSVAESLEAEPYRVVINATGVGMHRTVGLSPVDRDLVSLCEWAVDLIYAPSESAFLRLAREEGKRTVNGLAMLFYQAYYAQCIFFGCKPDDGQAKELFEQYRSEYREEV